MYDYILLYKTVFSARTFHKNLIFIDRLWQIDKIVILKKNVELPVFFLHTIWNSSYD